MQRVQLITDMSKIYIYVCLIVNIKYDYWVVMVYCSTNVIIMQYS